ncbi:DUF5590 domain-containing protein [Aerococcus sp. 1KP-2016]|jgi:uncharacterized protein YpmB|uniref:cell wall elongation regulator TseB-like domain-containing protein n=1 Tax=Aerococcus sp. 1KP-2016 TaxID=1981982 RepID=UPI000B993FE4|nr:DUF5590 domain-containing protein [Aerococcus sp. 1KP-2016]OYQ66210.1 hypothetical protein B9P78_06805 [Aerococcus sp. 1KP-2016]
MKRKLFSILMAIMVIYLVGTSYVYFSSQQPVAEAESKTTKLAKEAGITNIQTFYVFNKDETYYSVLGENAEGRQVYFTYQPDTDYTKSGFMDEMVNEENALALTLYEMPNVKVRNANLGIENDTFVWEVSFTDEEGNLGYHYINATTGEWYETVNDL